jgi:protein-L-isoaspartate O-methyltransferase
MLAMQPAILGTAFVALLFFAYSHLVGAIWVPAPTGDVRAVLDRLQLGRSATFLELGAGSGNIAVLATEYFDTVQAVEVNPLMFAVARLRTQWSEQHRCNISSLRPAGLAQLSYGPKSDFLTAQL